jgi:TatD DNase family protein
MTAPTVPDVHCHLDQVQEAERAVHEAIEAGVGPIFAVGMRRASSERALELRTRFPEQVWAAVGLHPSEIPALDAATLRRELDFVRATLSEADGLGEVGLDFKDARDAVQQERQREALREQLQWAAELGKPVNMHCRRAEREIVEIAIDFTRRTRLGVNLHWFTHSEKLAVGCGAAGVFISPGPSILHDAKQAHVAAHIAPDWLLLETDSPVEYAGEPARPAWAARVARRLAELRGEPFDELARRLQSNLQRYRDARTARGGGM